MTKFRIAEFRMAEFRMAEFRMAEFRMAEFRMTKFRMAEFSRIQPFFNLPNSAICLKYVHAHFHLFVFQ